MGLVSDPLLSQMANNTQVVVVLRNTNGERTYHRGEIVDGGKWRNLANLIQRRHVAPLPYGYDLDTTVVVTFPDDEEVKFVNQELADIALNRIADRLPPEEASEETGEEETESEGPENELPLGGADTNEEETGEGESQEPANPDEPAREEPSTPPEPKAGRGGRGSRSSK